MLGCVGGVIDKGSEWLIGEPSSSSGEVRCINLHANIIVGYLVELVSVRIIIIIIFKKCL